MSGYYYGNCNTGCYTPKKPVNKVVFKTTSKKVFIAEVTFKGFGEVEVSTLIQHNDGFCLQVPPGVKEMIVHVLIARNDSYWANSAGGEPFNGDEDAWTPGDGTDASAGFSAAWHIDLCTNVTTALFMSNYLNGNSAQSDASCSSLTCGSVKPQNLSSLCVNCATSNFCCRNTCLSSASAANVTGANCDNCTEITFTVHNNVNAS